MGYWLQKYTSAIRGGSSTHLYHNENDLGYWQDEIFFTFLAWFLPVSFIAVIPGVYMSLKDGFAGIAMADIGCVIFAACITFGNRLDLMIRKGAIVVMFYFLAIFLTSVLGYIGPGVFYLFSTTILLVLILPTKFAYWGVAANTLILLSFALVIGLKLFDSPLIKDYTPGKWIAFSSNLVFLNIVGIALIDKLFKGLQKTISNKDQLQERYKKIFDKSPLPMWLFDTDNFQFLDVNDAAVQHYGYSKSEFLQMTVKDIRPQRDIKSLENVVKLNAQTGAFYDGKAEHTKKNGEHIYVNIESNLLEFEDHKARLVLATDITSQLTGKLEVLTANLKVKESEANLKAIFESTVNGYVLLDKDLNIKLFNSKAKDHIIFSNGDKEFKIGESIFEYVDATRHDYFRNLINKVYTTQLIEFDRKYRNAGRPMYWIRYTMTPVYKDSKIDGVCITGRDVTDRKLYVKTVEDQNKTFREISWMQSHLVRAPLARIMGLNELLKHAASDEETAEILSYLDEASQELDGIIKQITVRSNEIVERYPSYISANATS